MNGFEQIQFEHDVNYIAKFSDGALITFLNGDPEKLEDLKRVRPERPVLVRHSHDHGATWSEPALSFTYPSDIGFSMPVVSVVDHTDRVHVFGLRFLEVNWPDGPWDSQLLHTWSDDRGGTWSSTQAIDFGHAYTGSINCAIVLESGRILVPISYFEPARTSGKFVSMCVFSDDGGQTWGRSNDCAIEGGGEFVESGATEPVVVQLNSGLVWMVIRTVSGYFWESFSNDGSVWTPPQQTRIVSCNAPAGVTRLSDGSLALSWNNRYGAPMHAHGISYARQKLHLARSFDDGQTWSVPKEIARIADDDPDNIQTTYPYLIEAADGALIVVYHRIRSAEWRGWHYPIREVLRINPDWISTSGR